MQAEAEVPAGQDAKRLRVQIAELQRELEAERSIGLLRRLFGLQPRAAETPEQARERMRGVTATALIRTLIAVVAPTFLYLWWLSRTFAQLTTDELVTVIPIVGTTLLTPIVGLIGAVIGFCYGGQAAAQATQATQAATEATMTRGLAGC